MAKYVLILSLFQYGCVLYPLEAGLNHFKKKTLECDHSDENIVDIYYSPKIPKAQLIAHINTQTCPFTLTECDWDCGTYYVQRKHYDLYAQRFLELDLTPNHPRRSDKDRLYYPAARSFLN